MKLIMQPISKTSKQKWIHGQNKITTFQHHDKILRNLMTMIELKLYSVTLLINHVTPNRCLVTIQKNNSTSKSGDRMRSIHIHLTLKSNGLSTVMYITKRNHISCPLSTPYGKLKNVVQLKEG